MYDPAVNSGTGETTPPWSCQMTDQSYQFLQYRHPVGMHRCVSQPFLGESYNYPTCTSPIELQQPGVHQRRQSLNRPMFPDQACLYGYNAQPHFPNGMVPNPNFKNVEVVQGHAKVSRQLQELKVADCEQGHSKMPNQAYYDMIPNQPELSYPTRKVEDWTEENEDWKKKFECANRELRVTKEYMKDLNTKEDNMRMQIELHKSEDRKHSLELQITWLEKQNKKLSKTLSEKEQYVNILEQKYGKLKSDYQRPTKDVPKKSVDKENLQDVVAERDEILQQLKQAKNCVAVQKLYSRDLKLKYNKEVLELKENLSKEMDSVISLNNDIVRKDNNIDTLKKQIKESMTQKQSILEELNDLHEQVKRYAQSNSSDEEKKILQRQLFKEMGTAVYELKNLAEFCIKDHNGDDMSISLIVGTRAISNPIAPAEISANAEQFLKFQICEVKKLREEIQKLQDMLTNHYAVRVGSQLRL